MKYGSIIGVTIAMFCVWTLLHKPRPSERQNLAGLKTEAIRYEASVDVKSAVVLTKPDPIGSVSAKIERVDVQIKELKHQLQNFGFPQVLLNKNLNNADRLQILVRLKELSNLQIQRMHLNIQRVDLRAEAL